MAIKGFNGKIRNVNSLDVPGKQRAKDFLQGLVYCWCKNQPGKEFAAQYLVGGKNKNWNKTPLQRVYDYRLACYIKRGKSKKEAEDDAHSQAAKDVGWLLKSMLHDDKRKFKQIKGGRVNFYKWPNK